MILAAIVTLAILPWWMSIERTRRDCATLTPALVDDAAAVTPVSMGAVIALVAAACRSGFSVPRALSAVGHVTADARGRDLAKVARALTLGADWSTAWELTDRSELAPLAQALEVSWRTGAPVDPALTALRQLQRNASVRGARIAAGELGIKLTLPLGVCFLPAFFCAGLIPVVLAIVQDFHL